MARYLEELAATYHKWYNVERVVPMALTDPETRGDDEARKALEIAKNPEPARAAARLKLNDAVQQVIANGLDLLASPPPKRCDYAYFSNLAGRYDCECRSSIEFHGRTAESLLDEFGSPLYLIDTDEVVARARHFVRAAAEAFNTSTTHVSFAGKAFLSKEVVRLVTEAGMFVDTCTMGEMKIALAAGVPGRRLVLHGNNKSDEEIALAIEQASPKSWSTSPTSRNALLPSPASSANAPV